jgi:hypothetical protein
VHNLQVESLFFIILGNSEKEVSQLSNFGHDGFRYNSITLHELHERLLYGSEVEHIDRRMHARQRLRLAATGERSILLQFSSIDFHISCD